MGVADCSCGGFFGGSDLTTHCAEDAFLTHQHHEASVASYAVALAVSMALDPAGFQLNTFLNALPHSYIKDAVRDAFILATNGTDPDEALEVLGRRGNAIQTVGSAFYYVFRNIAMHALSFESCVVEAIQAGGDTDTRGAIVGAIMGTLVGVEGIPEHLIRGLYQASYIQELDAKLVVLSHG